MVRFFAIVGIIAIAIWLGPALSDIADSVSGAGAAVVKEQQQEGGQ